jgi:hypothetical protein
VVPVNLSRLDLNLVVALRALLEERNVTRAGERIGLSQPAMSAALSRLRRHFDDELLARTGNSYELTPLGTALRDRSATACDLLERVFSSQADFDPAAETREFTLLASDYGAAVFGAALARALHQEAPGIRLTFQHPAPSVVENAAAVLSTVDGLLLPTAGRPSTFTRTAGCAWSPMITPRSVTNSPWTSWGACPGPSTSVPTTPRRPVSSA